MLHCLSGLSTNCKVTLRLVLFLVAHTSMRACCCPNVYALCHQSRIKWTMIIHYSAKIWKRRNLWWQNVCYKWLPRLKSTPKHMPPIPRSINQPLWGHARETNMPSEGAQGSCEFQSCAQIWLWNYPKVERLFRLFSFETNCFSLSSIHTFKRFSLISMYLNVESTSWDVLPIFFFHMYNFGQVFSF